MEECGERQKQRERTGETEGIKEKQQMNGASCSFSLPTILNHLLFSSFLSLSTSHFPAPRLSAPPSSLFISCVRVVASLSVWALSLLFFIFDKLPLGVGIFFPVHLYLIVCVCKTERDRDTGRQKNRHRQKDRDREAGLRETERETGTQRRKDKERDGGQVGGREERERQTDTKRETKKKT
jgi:hypothetical protein